jgi:hypothetical protein
MQIKPGENLQKALGRNPRTSSSACDSTERYYAIAYVFDLGVGMATFTSASPRKNGFQQALEVPPRRHQSPSSRCAVLLRPFGD